MGEGEFTTGHLLSYGYFNGIAISPGAATHRLGGGLSTWHSQTVNRFG
jgi:hypothetical protein